MKVQIPDNTARLGQNAVWNAVFLERLDTLPGYAILALKRLVAVCCRGEENRVHSRLFPALELSLEEFVRIRPDHDNIVEVRRPLVSGIAIHAPVCTSRVRVERETVVAFSINRE